MACHDLQDPKLGLVPEKNITVLKHYEPSMALRELEEPFFWGTLTIMQVRHQAARLPA